MTVNELMERVGIEATGKTLFYIKDGLEEMNMMAETHIKTVRIGITENKRFYDIPKDMIKLSDIRCKNNLNSKDEYRGIPRLIGEPWIEDADQEM
jgi:hypothetical protein